MTTSGTDDGAFYWAPYLREPIRIDGPLCPGRLLLADPHLRARRIGRKDLDALPVHLDDFDRVAMRVSAGTVWHGDADKLPLPVGLLAAPDHDVPREASCPRVVPVGPDHSGGWPAEHVLREIETLGILSGRGAIHGKPHHYVLASGVHVDAYVRLRDGLVDPYELDRLAEWIVPGLRDGDWLLAAHTSLLPLAQAVVSCVLRRREAAPEIAVREPFARSSASATGATGATSELLHRIGAAPASALVLLGVEENGRHERAYSSIADGLGHDLRFVSVVDRTASPAGPTGECLARVPIQQWSNGPTEKERCPYCADGPTDAFRVHRVTEDFSRHDEGPIVKIDSRRIAQNLGSKRVLWAAADEWNALRFHHDEDFGEARAKRHRPIHFDVPALLNSKDFLAKCRATLVDVKTEYSFFAGVVADFPGCQAANELRTLTASVNVFHDARAILKFEPGRVAKLVASLLQRFDDWSAGEHPGHARPTILLIDDVAVTGRSLGRMARQIADSMARERPRLRGAIEFVSYTPLACPADPDDLLLVRNNLRTAGDRAKKRVFSTFTAYLPASGRTFCPWCQEQRALEDALPRLAHGRAVVGDRINTLASKVDRDHYAFGDTPPSDSPTDDRVVRDAFIGNELHGSAVFAAYVSETQQAIHADDSGRSRDHIPLIDFGHALSWTDSSMVAGILRACGNEHTNHRRLEDGFARLSRDRRDRLVAPDKDRLLRELLWAVCQGKLPADASQRIMTMADTAITTSQDTSDGRDSRYLEALMGLADLRRH